MNQISLISNDPFFLFFLGPSPNYNNNASIFENADKKKERYLVVFVTSQLSSIFSYPKKKKKNFSASFDGKLFC